MVNEEEIEEQMPETEEETAEAMEDKELEETLNEEEIEETAPEPEAAEEKEAEEEEEAKPEKKKKGKDEEEIVEERVYVIPLGKANVRPPKKRAPRAMQLIRAFITKHMKIEMKVEEEEEEELPRLTISQEVNEKVWGRGIEKPPRKIRVRAAKDKDGNVTVYLAEGE